MKIHIALHVKYNNVITQTQPSSPPFFWVEKFEPMTWVAGRVSLAIMQTEAAALCSEPEEVAIGWGVIRILCLLAKWPASTQPLHCMLWSSSRVRVSKRWIRQWQPISSSTVTRYCDKKSLQGKKVQGDTVIHQDPAASPASFLPWMITRDA